MLVGLYQGLQFVEIPPDRLGSGAVIALEKVVVQRLDVLIRIPQQLGQNPGPQLGELGVRRLVRPLLEQAHDAVIAKELCVPLQTLKIGMRAEIVPKIRRVIPHVQLVGNGRPALDVLDELLILGEGARVQRHGEIALDGAQPRHYVVPGLQRLGRMARILVGQRLDPDIGEFPLDRFGYLVDEVDHRARGRTFALVDRAAVRAFAPSAPIVLADAEQFGLRILADPRQHAFGHDPQHVRVGQAQLGVLRGPLAVPQAVILRVFGKELAGRQQRIERVDEQIAAKTDLAAVPLLQIGPIAVDFAPRGEVAVEHAPPERLAHGKGGDLRLVELRDRPGFEPRDDAVMFGIPAAASVFLEQLVHAVQRAADRAAEDQQVRGAGHQAKAVVAQLARLGRCAEHLFRVPRDAQQDGLRRQRLVIGGDRHFGAGHLPHESLQLLGSVALRRRRVGRANDRKRARRLGRERQAALLREGRGTGQHQQGSERTAQACHWSAPWNGDRRAERSNLLPS